MRRFILTLSTILWCAISVFSEDIPNNQVWYTTTDNTVETFKGNWGADIISNTYAEGKGVVLFSGDVSTVPPSAFDETDHLTSIVLPNSIKRIESRAFYSCYELTSYNLPSALVYIGESAFDELPNATLTELVIPQNVDTIGESAFCYSKAKRIIIPNSTTRIEAYAFASMKNLQYLSIGKNVSFIGGAAFTISSGQTDQLDTIICYATNPPYCDIAIMIGTAFKERSNNIPLFVPRESVELYKTTYPWNMFKNNTYAIEGELGHDASVESVTILQQDGDALPAVEVTPTDSKATSQIIQANEVTKEAVITVISEDGDTENSFSIKFVRKQTPTSNNIIQGGTTNEKTYDILGRNVNENTKGVVVGEDTKYIIY